MFDDSTPRRSARTVPRVRVAGVVLVAAAVVLVAAMAVPATAQSDGPTVRVGDAAVAQNETATVRVELSSAPSGLSGYNLELSVADPGVARVEGATYPDAYGLTTEPQVEDGRTVTLEAADLEGNVEPGASNVTLATVEVTGRTSGEVRVTVESVGIDDDTGNRLDPTVQPATVTVTEDGAGSGGTTPAESSRETGTDAEGSERESGTASDDGTPEAGGGDATAAPGETDDGTGTPGASGDLPVSVALVALGVVLVVGALLGRHT